MRIAHAILLVLVILICLYGLTFGWFGVFRRKS